MNHGRVTMDMPCAVGDFKEQRIHVSRVEYGASIPIVCEQSVGWHCIPRADDRAEATGKVDVRECVANEVGDVDVAVDVDVPRYASNSFDSYRFPHVCENGSISVCDTVASE